MNKREYSKWRKKKGLMQQISKANVHTYTRNFTLDDFNELIDLIKNKHE